MRAGYWVSAFLWLACIWHGVLGAFFGSGMGFRHGYIMIELDHEHS